MSEIGELRQQDNSEQPKGYTVENCLNWREVCKRPDGTVIERGGSGDDLLNELNALLARAEKAEAALEIAQKMCDHWEAKAAERLESFNECRTMLGDRIELLRESRDEWVEIARDNEARAEKAEAERDELKRKLSDSEDEKLDLVKLSCVDWERVRIDAAIAAMQSLMPDLRELSYSTKWVVQRADALVAELKKEVQG